MIDDATQARILLDETTAPGMTDMESVVNALTAIGYALLALSEKVERQTDCNAEEMSALRRCLADLLP